ncbi:MAG: hypothetical protein EXR73_00890 [Myxococcales bacterium]|nr:hypothetical protein [Myxococcales bacterium]
MGRLRLVNGAMLAACGVGLLLGSAVVPPVSAATLPAQDGSSPTWRLLERIAEARGFGAEFAALPPYLAQMVAKHDISLGKTRLKRVMESLSQPWHAPMVAAELRDGATAALPKLGSQSGGVALTGFVREIGNWLDVVPVEPLEPALQELDALWLKIAPPLADAKTEGRPVEVAVVDEELLDLLSSYVAGCHDALAALLTGVSDGDRALLRSSFVDFAAAFALVHDPKGQLSVEQNALIEKWKALAWKLDRVALLAVSERVARLTLPPFLATLGRRLAKTARTQAKVDGFSGDVIATAGVRDESRVVLLGTGKTIVRGAAALVIDLGGDDTWARAAVVDGESPRVSVVIDLAGNDRWGSSEASGPAFATCGVALAIDVKGKDHYTSGRLGQGSAALGFAALIDLEGDDVYVAHDYVQGYSFAGIGLLIDRAGNDSYSAWAYAQGGGNGNGFAALIDGGGDDRYVANGHWPDVYGDSGPGSFHGASQGYSFGFRDGQQLAGGLALCADLGNGTDYYESGNFSMGGAYYFGFGLLYDGGGDDENHGYRYSQGFGVHQAVGVRWDAGGNDRYETKCAANCGAGWDEGVGWLIDDAGDDQYDVGGLALGGTANSAVAILLDGGGNDRYGGGGGADSQGGSGDSSYHTFQAIGALLDFGGGKDSYTKKERGDGLVRTGEWFGLFVDVKEKDATTLLALPASSTFWKKTVGSANGTAEAEKPAKPAKQ